MLEDENKYAEVFTPDEERSDVDETADTTPDNQTVVTAEAVEQPVDSETPADLPVEVSAVAPVNPPEDTPVESASGQCEEETIPANDDSLKQIDGRLEKIEMNEQRLFSEVREMHKLYHSEFAGRLKAMQDELEHYRKIDKGRVFDDILAAIARIYGNNETLADEVSEPKAQKSIRYMLMDIEELLEMYGMERLRSSEGDKRNPRHCQVLNRVMTDDPAKHDTVAKSYNSGFYIGNRTVIKEVVDVYIFDGQTPAQETDEEQKIESGDIPVVE